MHHDAIFHHQVMLGIYPWRDKDIVANLSKADARLNRWSIPGNAPSSGDHRSRRERAGEYGGDHNYGQSREGEPHRYPALICPQVAG
jgi:hypothetical protein